MPEGQSDVNQTLVLFCLALTGARSIHEQDKPRALLL